MPPKKVDAPATQGLVYEGRATRARVRAGTAAPPPPIPSGTPTRPKRTRSRKPTAAAATKTTSTPRAAASTKTKPKAPAQAKIARAKRNVERPKSPSPPPPRSQGPSPSPDDEVTPTPSKSVQPDQPPTPHTPLFTPSRNFPNPTPVHTPAPVAAPAQPSPMYDIPLPEPFSSPFRSSVSSPCNRPKPKKSPVSRLLKRVSALPHERRVSLLQDALSTMTNADVRRLRARISDGGVGAEAQEGESIGVEVKEQLVETGEGEEENEENREEDGGASTQIESAVSARSAGSQRAPFGELYAAQNDRVMGADEKGKHKISSDDDTLAEKELDNPFAGTDDSLASRHAKDTLDLGHDDSDDHFDQSHNVVYTDENAPFLAKFSPIQIKREYASTIPSTPIGHRSAGAPAYFVRFPTPSSGGRTGSSQSSLPALSPGLPPSSPPRNNSSSSPYTIQDGGKLIPPPRDATHALSLSYSLSVCETAQRKLAELRALKEVVKGEMQSLAVEAMLLRAEAEAEAKLTESLVERLSREIDGEYLEAMFDAAGRGLEGGVDRLMPFRYGMVDEGRGEMQESEKDENNESEQEEGNEENEDKENEAEENEAEEDKEDEIVDENVAPHSWPLEQGERKDPVDENTGRVTRSSNKRIRDDFESPDVADIEEVDGDVSDTESADSRDSLALIQHVLTDKHGDGNASTIRRAKRARWESSPKEEGVNEVKVDSGPSDDAAPKVPEIAIEGNGKSGEASMDQEEKVSFARRILRSLRPRVRRGTKAPPSASRPGSPAS